MLASKLGDGGVNRQENGGDELQPHGTSAGGYRMTPMLSTPSLRLSAPRELFQTLSLALLRARTSSRLRP